MIISPTGESVLGLVGEGPGARTVRGACARLDDDVAQRAIQHRVAGAVAWTAEQRGLAITPLLREACVATTMARLATVADLSAMSQAFSEAGIDFLAFKGLILSTVAYRDRFDRPAADLDVLVRPDQVRRCLDVLERFGATHLDHNWEYMVEQMIGELHFVLPGGTSLDLHWHLLVNRHLRRRFRPDHEALFRSSRHVVVDGVGVRTFGPAETLVYSCLHACISGGHRLVWLKDLEQLMLHDDVEWDDIVRVARSWGCHLQVAMMLQRTASTLGLAIDPRALLDLAGSRSFMAVCRQIDRECPAVDVVDDEGFLRLATRSVADSVPHTMVRFVGRATSFGRRRLLHRDVDDPLVLVRDRPGAGARDRYLETVERWGVS